MDGWGHKRAPVDLEHPHRALREEERDNLSAEQLGNRGSSPLNWLMSLGASKEAHEVYFEAPAAVDCFQHVCGLGSCFFTDLG